MTETWRPVVGYEGLYEVSDIGRVASLPKWHFRDRRILKSWHDEDGYPSVNLCASGSRRRYAMHVLVAEAFVGPRPDGLMVRHLDGKPTNNQPANLQWGTAKENVQDMLAHGTGRNQRKTKCIRNHPFNTTNTHITRKGVRRCRRCDALAHAEAARIKKEMIAR